MENKKGIELVKQEDSGISLTIGKTTLKPGGGPVSLRLEKQASHVFLIIDTSGSMAGEKLEQAKLGILDFARDAFRKEYGVGLIGFDTAARLVCEPTHDIKVLKNGLTGLSAGGTTNMSAAIRLAHEHFNRVKDTRVMVVATDGLPDSAQEALNEAARAKQDGIDIITIGTDDADQDFLKKLATRSELGKKVTRAAFSRAISDASSLLPAPKSISKRK
jgi:Mg-chelatase subunit ChlD